MSIGQEAALLFKIGADPSNAISEMKRLESAVKQSVSQVVSSFPGGQFLAPFINEITRTSSTGKKGLKEVEDSATGAGGALAGIAGPGAIAAAAVVAVGAAAVGAAVGVVRMGEHVADVAGKFWDLHQRLNVNVETLSALDTALRMNGKTIEDAQMAITAFEQKMGQVENGNKKAIKSFDALGITSKNLDGALNQAFASLSKMPEGVDQFNRAADVFTKRGAGVMLAALKEAGGSLDQFKENLRDSGLLIDSQTAQMADRFGDLEAQISMRLEGAQRAMTARFLPALIVAFEGVDAALDNNKKNWRTWGDVIADTIAGATALAMAAQKASQSPNYLGLIHPALGMVPTFLASPSLYLAQTVAKFPDSAREVALAIEKVKADAFDAAQKAAKASKSGATGTGGGGKRAKSGASEEDAETRAHIKELEIQQKAAERIYRESTASIEREYKLRAMALADYVEQEKAAQAVLLKAQLKTIDAEIAAAEKLHKSRDRDVKIAELNEKRAAAVSANAKEIQKIDDFAGEEQIATLRKRQETLYRIREEFDQQHIAQFRYYAERRVISEEAAEKQIGQTELTALDLKKGRIQDDLALMNEQSEAYKQLKNDLALLEVQRAGLEEDIERRTFEARRRDVANYRQYIGELTALREENMRASLDAAQVAIDLMRSHFESKKEVDRVQLNHDIAAENARHQEAVNGLLQKQSENLDSLKTQAEKNRIEKELNEAEETEAQRHAFELQRIKEQAYAQAHAGYFSGEFRGAQPEFDADGNIIKKATAGQNAIAGLNYALRDMEKIGKESFKSFAAALGQTVQNFVLLSTTGPAALRKMTASVLAELAAQATVKASMAFADGLIALFTNPAEAAADFSAAALYASIAGGAALVGRATAGDLFQQQQATGATGAGSSNGNTADSGPRVITENRNQWQQKPIPIHLEVNLRSQTDEGHTLKVVNAELRSHGSELSNNVGQVSLKVWHEDMWNNGHTRRAIIDVAES